MAKPWTNIPRGLPASVMLTPHMSARLKQDTVDAVFTAAGGGERLLAFVEKDDENYKFFLQHLWGKGIPRVTNAEVSMDAEGVETLLARLDAGESAKVVSPDGRDAPSVVDHEEETA